MRLVRIVWLAVALSVLTACNSSHAESHLPTPHKDKRGRLVYVFPARINRSFPSGTLSPGNVVRCGAKGSIGAVVPRNGQGVSGEGVVAAGARKPSRGTEVTVTTHLDGTVSVSCK